MVCFFRHNSIDITQTKELVRKAPDNNDSFDVIISALDQRGCQWQFVCLCDLTLIIKKALPGELITACQIDNFIGQPNGILGPDLGLKMNLVFSRCFLLL